MRASLAFLLLATLAVHGHVFAEEEDIITISQRNPLQVYVGPNGGKLAQYGDPHLAEAVSGLSDLPQPWTVPKVIAVFENERAAWNAKMKETFEAHKVTMWEGWEKESKHLGLLVSLLAASRDPRAALALESTLDDKSRGAPDAGIRALEGLHSYFLGDPRYHPIPPADRVRGFSTNLYVEFEKEVKIWRRLNDAELPAKAAAEETAHAGDKTK